MGGKGVGFSAWGTFRCCIGFVPARFYARSVAVIHCIYVYIHTHHVYMSSANLLMFSLSYLLYYFCCGCCHYW